MTASVRDSVNLLAPALDREQPLAGPAVVLRGQLALEHLHGRAAERGGGRDSGDRLGGLVPEHDLAVPVDGDDPVGDVGENRDAPLPLDRDSLVELGVREHRRRVPGQRDQRLDLLLPPGARALRVDGQHAVQPCSTPTSGTPRYAV